MTALLVIAIFILFAVYVSVGSLLIQIQKLREALAEQTKVDEALRIELLKRAMLAERVVATLPCLIVNKEEVNANHNHD